MAMYKQEIHDSEHIHLVQNGFEITSVFQVFNVPDASPMAVLNEPGLLPAYGDAFPGDQFPNTYVNDMSIVPIPSKDMCKVTIKYKPNEDTATQNQAGEIWEFVCSAETIHITSVDDPSKQKNYPNVEWNDPGEAIGVDGDNVEGADVYRPATRIRVTKIFTEGEGAGKMNNQFRTKILNAQAKTNNESWPSSGEFDSAEVLFLGATMSQIAQQQATDKVTWRVVFEFAAAKKQSRTVVIIGDDSPVKVTYNPWEYVWLRFANVPAANKSTQVNIQSVHVAEVYDDTNFSVFHLAGPST